MVTKLKRLFPVMGRRRIADFLARAGLHIAPSTVRRMLKRAPATETPAPVAPAKNPGEPLSLAKPHTVIANYPNHVWGIDTTAVPTSAGFWTSWFPFSLAQSWPFCWWVASSRLCRQASFPEHREPCLAKAAVVSVAPRWRRIHSQNPVTRSGVAIACCPGTATTPTVRRYCTKTHTSVMLSRLGRATRSTTRRHAGIVTGTSRHSA